MACVALTFLLMGKTGHGKSKTGNWLLDRKKEFRVSANTTSETKDVNMSFAEIDNFRLTVVDGPGLEDTDMAKAADKETAAANMAEALAMCDGGVDAFLFVIKFGNRFTEEERSALEALKRTFGADYMKHLIVVLTGGDLFEPAMEEEECNITFDEWCRKQQGTFRQLCDDCEGRVVLVNNYEKDESRKHVQRHQILQLTEDLKTRNGKYTSQSFQDAKAERERMIVEHRAPELGQKVQEKVSLLATDTEHLSGNISSSQRVLIHRRIQDLTNEIIEQDKGTRVLDNWMRLVTNLENNLHNVVERQRLAAELETLKREKKRRPWWQQIAAAIMSIVIAPLIPLASHLGN